MLRFTNENSYLNWARNGVLSSAVGVSMYDQEHHRGAQLSGAGLLLLGFSFITVRLFCIRTISLDNIRNNLYF